MSDGREVWSAVGTLYLIIPVLMKSAHSHSSAVHWPPPLRTMAEGAREPGMFSNPYLYLYAFGSFSNGLFISLRGPIIPELART